MARPTIDDVTPALSRALLVIKDENPIGVRALGRALKISPARAGQLVTRLTALQWVKRSEAGLTISALGDRVLRAHDAALVAFTDAL